MKKAIINGELLDSIEGHFQRDNGYFVAGELPGWLMAMDSSVTVCRWHVDEFYIHLGVAFDKEEDYTIFCLRWS